MVDEVLLPNGQVISLPFDGGGASPLGPSLIIGEALEGTPQGSDPARPTAASVSPQLSFVVPASQAGFAVLSGTVRQSLRDGRERRYHPLRIARSGGK